MYAVWIPPKNVKTSDEKWQIDCDGTVTHVV